MSYRLRRTRRPQRCGFGCVIPANRWAWFGRWRGGARVVLCVTCGREQYHLEVPDEERDGKMAALGEDA